MPDSPSLEASSTLNRLLWTSERLCEGYLAISLCVLAELVLVERLFAEQDAAQLGD